MIERTIKMKKIVKIAASLLCAAVIMTVCSVCALAAEQNENAEDTAKAVAVATTEEEAEADGEKDVASSKSIAAAVIIAVASGVGAIAMALAVYKSVDSTARQPEAANGIRTTMMMGLVFIETAIIYALIVAILVIFVL